MKKIILVIIVFFYIYALVCIPILCQILKTGGAKTTGVITPYYSDGYYRGVKRNFFYEFEYNGRRYEGNSLIPKDSDVVGDSIEILFFEFWPSFNRPVSYFE